MLDIIHGRTRKVSRQVDLKSLTDLSILVDKYELHEAVAIFSDTWINALKKDVPYSLEPDVLPWLCISWVFSNAASFKQVTQVLQRQSVSRIDADYLPIPDAVIGITKLSPNAHL